MNPHLVTKQFEEEICNYTGAPFAVTVNSCTMAILLACAYHKVGLVKIPKRTYVSVPQSIIHAGGVPEYEDLDWIGQYQLKPYPIYDSARLFTSGMYKEGTMQCVSFHWSKTLGLQQGGAILHDNDQADEWLRRARFDGRNEGIAPKDDTFKDIGWHCYLSPEISALGLMRLSLLPKDNAPLPNDPYPDLSTIDSLKGVPTWDV